MLKENNETKKATAKSPAGKKATGNAVSIPVMYVGSGIVGIVSHGDIFKDGLPECVQNAIKEQKAVESLIVSITKAGDALKEVKEKGSCYVLSWSSNRRESYIDASFDSGILRIAGGYRYCTGAYSGKSGKGNQCAGTC